MRLYGRANWIFNPSAIRAIIGASIVIMTVAQPATGKGTSSALVAFSLCVTANCIFSSGGLK